MFGLSRLLNKLRFRRLTERAAQFASVYFDSMNPVYPVEVQSRTGQSETPQRVLVIAPHADDETFGMGGAIRYHLVHGDNVHVALLSDNTSSMQQEGMSKEDIAVLRMNEFHEAMKILGVASFSSFALTDAAFQGNTPKNNAMTALLVENQPDVLYLPSLFDNHQDHRIVNVWAGFALNSIPHTQLLCRGYEVWSPLPATAVLDITPFFEQKKQAIGCYRSQLRHIRYDHHITGLNAYRALTLENKAQYAEAFFEAPAQQYQAFVKKYLAS